MARFLRLRVRDGTALISAGATGTKRSFSSGDELVIRFEDAASLLRGKARRGVEILDDFEDGSEETKPDLELPR
jgi:hypothetical protein